VTSDKESKPRTKRGDISLTGRVYEIRTASSNKKSDLSQKIKELEIKLEKLQKDINAQK